LKRSCEKGIQNSAVHPSASTCVRACQTGSNPSSKSSSSSFGVVAVDADAARRDAEHVRSPPVEEGVEGDEDMLDLLGAVPSSERRLQRRSRLLLHAGADIQGDVVVEESDLGALGRLRAFGGLLLHEIVDHGRFGPRAFVEAAVHLHRFGPNSNGPRLLAVRGWIHGGLRGKRRTQSDGEAED
jgi:hypothetical protein